jgi:hypothetical protein
METNLLLEEHLKSLRLTTFSPGLFSSKKACDIGSTMVIEVSV